MVCYLYLPAVVRGEGLCPEMLALWAMGTYVCLQVAEWELFAGTQSWPCLLGATVPLPWRSGGRSPGRAAGTEGLRVSPPRLSRCGNTRLFWRWRHPVGEQLLSVERFLILKSDHHASDKENCIHPFTNGSVVWFWNKEHRKYEKMLRLMNGGMPDTIYGSLIILHCTGWQRGWRRRHPQLPALESGMSSACLSLLFIRHRHLATASVYQGHLPAGTTSQIKAWRWTTLNSTLRLPHFE